MATLVGALLIPTAYADGSVSFHGDIVPMLKARAELEQFITENFSVTDTGWGNRIGSATMPHMGGARMGPYKFQAVWHRSHGDVPVTLIIDTKIRFLDRHQHEIVGGDLRETRSVSETLDSIEIEPPDINSARSK
ncbi:hypothetical protein AB3X94_03890 [Paraburkholderia sp. BR10923]|uniref:hypothetical protein n=1 Tax=Paraburkholderia sp. BR10923 TaxID=3236992 RepID=UPI0034CE7048